MIQRYLLVAVLAATVLVVGCKKTSTQGSTGPSQSILKPPQGPPPQGGNAPQATPTSPKALE
jgi:hypothetical protein